MKYYLNIILAGLLIPWWGEDIRAQTQSPVVIKVDVPFPTQDKPQSKLWYAQDTWWAMLPTTSGPSVWKRTGTANWTLQEKITNELNGLPGRADVLLRGQSVFAVLVEPDRIEVIEMQHQTSSGTLQLIDSQTLFGSKSVPDFEGGFLFLSESDSDLDSDPESDSDLDSDPESKSDPLVNHTAIETATITQAPDGSLWVAADYAGSIWVWERNPQGVWSNGLQVASGITADDISQIFSTSKTVETLWSDQEKGFFGTSRNFLNETSRSWGEKDQSRNEASQSWSEPVWIGDRKSIADDHINIKVSSRDEVWMVTKNSFDGMGVPVFELWHRPSLDEAWKYRSFAPLTPEVHPSRPVVVLTEFPDVIFVGYTIYSTDRNKGMIHFSSVNTAQNIAGELNPAHMAVGEPKLAMFSSTFMINDLTTAKQSYPINAANWMVLASDREGNVYEADLRQLLMPAEIKPLIITEPVAHDSDDPAIWIHPTDPAQSLILGTDKHADGGLYVFDLEGKIIWDKTIKGLKRPNNVDVAYGLKLGGKKIDIAVVSERLTSNLRVFSLPDMKEIDGGGIPMFEGENGKDFRALMGIATYTDPAGEIYVIMGRKNGPNDGYLWQYRLSDRGDGQVGAKFIRKFGQFSGKQEIEAIAVDNELGYVYYSDEGVGIRKYDADPSRAESAVLGENFASDLGENSPPEQQEIALFGTDHFVGDHEGISIYKSSDSTGYLLVSDQFGHRFHVYKREVGEVGVDGKRIVENQFQHQNQLQNQHLGTVYVSARLSDGSEITSTSMNEHFPNGLFVVMSDDKTFHYYRWEDILDQLEKL